MKLPLLLSEVEIKSFTHLYNKNAFKNYKNTTEITLFYFLNLD